MATTAVSGRTRKPQRTQTSRQPQRISISSENTRDHVCDNYDFNYFDASLLARLELPSFSGDIIEFPEFWDRYDTLVHSKRTISNATKFSLLKSCLRGRALYTIDGLPVTNENYGIAIDILRSTYDNPPALRHLIYTKLLHLPQCDPDGRQLQQLYFQMLRLVRQYTAITPDSPEYGLGALLYNKLPRFVKSKIYDITDGQKNLTPSELMSLLADIVRKESTLLQIDNLSSPQQSYHTFTRFDRPPQYSSNTRCTTPQNMRTTHHSQRYTMPCPFCNRTSHAATSCRTISSAEERRKFAKMNKMCLKCLQQGHSTLSCNKPPCHICQYHHHPALCFKQESHEQPPTSPRGRSNTYNSHKSPHFQSTTDNYQCPRTPVAAEIRTINTTNNSQPSTVSVRQTHFSKENDTFNDNEHKHGTAQSDVSPSSYSTTLHHDMDDLSTPLPSSVLLMCTTVTLINPNDESKTISTTAFFDSGSTHSYITTEVAKQLQLQSTTPKTITLHTFGSSSPTTVQSNVHTLLIQLQDKTSYRISAQSLPILTQTMEVPINPIDPTLINARNTAIPTIASKPGILIGMDHFWNLVLSPSFYSVTLSNGYHLLNTRLGKVISGNKINTRLINTTVQEDETHTPFSFSNEVKLDELLQRFWSLDAEGILDNVITSDDEICLRRFNETIFYDNTEGRYIVQLPFKGDKKDLPLNIELAKARLMQNIKLLKRKPTLLTEYHKTIKDQLTRGIIEEVHEKQLPLYCHYLAHHAVISETSKTTKVRCVYDGSAKTKNHPSLNDLLYRGPVLLPDLTGLIIRSRLHPIIIASDIEKAFLMVGLDEESKDFTRFLWLKDPAQHPTTDNIVTYRFRRVPFGLISSPFLLAGTIRYHLSVTGTELGEKLIRNTYVDNIFHGVNSIEQGKEFYTESKDLFRQAGMNLRQYVSNSNELNKFFEKKEQETTKMNDNTKILGLCWNTKDDNFTIRLPTLPNSEFIWTKRQVLKVVAKTYDPLGWCSPVLFTAKLFLRALWKEKIGWDVVLPNHLVTQWTQITTHWNASEVTIPRRIIAGTTMSSTFEIHIFTDASKDGYCAVAYLVEVDKTRTTSIIMSRTRLSPLKSVLTIPRLELSAINLGSKLLKHIYTNIDIPIRKSFIWSDSKVALVWIKNGNNPPIFIRNRISSIKENAPEANLRFVPGSYNPADIGSRGMTIQQLISFEMWWKGPQFLAQSEEHWPKDISSENETTYYTETKETQLSQQSQEIIVHPERFSSWVRLLRVILTILLFFCKRSNKAKYHFGETTSTMYKKAQTILFRLTQSQFPPPDAVKKQLNLFFCEKLNLWKSKGRVDNADLSVETITPVYLPRESHITHLYILHIHLTNNHCGINQTLNEIRQHVWIPKGRITVKKVLNKLCFHCKRGNAKPYRLPEFPIHPARRVRRPCYPFENTGMDYAGPLLCKTDSNSSTKYWILLLTCLNTRAIYVDLVLSMSASTLLHTLRRFFATTAFPRWIICDNSKTFKTVADFQTSFNHDDKTNIDITDYCARRGIEFKFIPSFSPWQGGLYEKLIHLFKMSFKHALNNRTLQIEELRTIAKETEAIVNCRPLTYVSEENYVPPLRPIDFLRPWTAHSSPALEECEWKPKTTTKDVLIEEWNSMNKVLERFWKRWSSEYLTNLREQYRVNHPHPRCTNPEMPKKNDIVLIHDENLERGQWKIGKIVSSSDDYLRSAEVMLPSKKTVTRPVCMLYKLEIDKDKPKMREQENESEPKSSSSTQEKRRHSTAAGSFLHSAE